MKECATMGLNMKKCATIFSKFYVLSMHIISFVVDVELELGNTKI